MIFLLIPGSVSDSKLPYADVMSQHPSLEQMRETVLSMQLRPRLEDHWNLDHVSVVNTEICLVSIHDSSHNYEAWTSPVCIKTT